MLTIENLRAFGANVDEGLERCMSNEAFYLRLVGKAIGDPDFENLGEAVARGDLDSAFQMAHKLKGTTANLALTPICRPVTEMTELLRDRTETDYGPYLAEIAAQREKLRRL